MTKPKRPPPEGYEEIGETLAQPVLEGFRTDAWALELAELLGYDAKDLEEWKRYYKGMRKESLRRQREKRARRRQKIESSLQRAKELVEGVDVRNRSGYNS